MGDISESTGMQHFDVCAPLAVSLCENYVSNGLCYVMAAFDANSIIGFGALCESCSLYGDVDLTQFKNFT